MADLNYDSKTSLGGVNHQDKTFPSLLTFLANNSPSKTQTLYHAQHETLNYLFKKAKQTIKQWEMVCERVKLCQLLLLRSIMLITLLFYTPTTILKHFYAQMCLVEHNTDVSGDL